MPVRAGPGGMVNGMGWREDWAVPAAGRYERSSHASPARARTRLRTRWWRAPASTMRSLREWLLLHCSARGGKSICRRPAAAGLNSRAATALTPELRACSQQHPPPSTRLAALAWPFRGHRAGQIRSRVYVQHKATTPLRSTPAADRTLCGYHAQIPTANSRIWGTPTPIRKTPTPQQRTSDRVRRVPRLALGFLGGRLPPASLRAPCHSSGNVPALPGSARSVFTP